VNPKDWREDYHRLSPPIGWTRNMLVRPSAIDTEVDPRSLLRRVWHTGSGKVCSVPVGDDESAKLAYQLYKKLKRNGKSETIEKVIHSFTTISPEDVMKLILLLQQYNLVSVVEKPDGSTRGGER
jgi:hypothetical protein